jgi:hypothetical protein
MWWFAWVAGRDWWPAFPARAGVWDGQGQGFDLGDQGAQPAVVVEPLAVIVRLLVGDEPGDGLAVDLASQLPVGAVQDGRAGVAAAAGLARTDVPLDEGAGQGEAEAGELGGDACGAGAWQARSRSGAAARRRPVRTDRPGCRLMHRPRLSPPQRSLRSDDVDMQLGALDPVGMDRRLWGRL